MRLIYLTELFKISGGEASSDLAEDQENQNYYQEVIKPVVIIGGSTIAGVAGSAATAIIMYGIEGFIEALPDAMDATEKVD